MNAVNLNSYMKKLSQLSRAQATLVRIGIAALVVVNPIGAAWALSTSRFIPPCMIDLPCAVGSAEQRSY
jgi:hypothetical protein